MQNKIFRYFCLKIKENKDILIKKSLNSVSNIDSFKSFNNLIKDENPILLYGLLNYCKISKETLPMILKEYSNDIEYNESYKLHVFDMEKLSEITNYLQVNESPCLLLLNNQNIIDIIKGRPSLKQYKDLLKDVHKIIQNNNKANNIDLLSESLSEKIFIKNNYKDSLEELDYLINKFKDNEHNIIVLEILKSYCLYNLKKLSNFEELMNLLMYKEKSIELLSNINLKDIYYKLKSKSLNYNTDINDMPWNQQINYLKLNYNEFETLTLLNIIYNILNNKGVIDKRELIKIGNTVLHKDKEIDEESRKIHRDKLLKYII